MSGAGVQVSLTTSTVHKVEEIHKNSFNFINKLGKGAYGQVHLVKNKNSDQLFALKEVDRLFVEKVGKVESIFRERDILQACNLCE